MPNPDIFETLAISQENLVHVKSLNFYLLFGAQFRSRDLLD